LVQGVAGLQAHCPPAKRLGSEWSLPLIPAVWVGRASAFSLGAKFARNRFGQSGLKPGKVRRGLTAKSKCKFKHREQAKCKFADLLILVIIPQAQPSLESLSRRCLSIVKRLLHLCEAGQCHCGIWRPENGGNVMGSISGETGQISGVMCDVWYKLLGLMVSQTCQSNVCQIMCLNLIGEFLG